MNIKDVNYTIGYRWVDNQVEVSIDLPDQTYSISAYDANICQVKNKTTGVRLHGLMLTESIVRFPNDVFSDDEDDVVMFYKGVEYDLTTLAKVASNDCRTP